MSAFKAFSPPPIVKPHQHTHGTCPVTGHTHGFCPPQEGDIRSPCPALNALANHGYLPRDGKNVHLWQIIKGLRKGYGLTLPFAMFLTYGTFVFLKQRPRAIDLNRIAEHDRVEHNASLVHKDTPSGERFAPLEVDGEMLKQSMEWFTTPEEDDKGKEPAADEKGAPQEVVQVVRAEDVARVRINRELRSPPLDAVHAEVARGEMAIALLVFETPASLARGASVGIPTEWLREWLGTERMPKGGTWRPSHKIGLFATVNKSKQIRLAAAAHRARLGDQGRPGSLWEKGITNGGGPKESTSPANKDAAKEKKDEEEAKKEENKGAGEKEEEKKGKMEEKKNEEKGEKEKKDEQGGKKSEKWTFRWSFSKAQTDAPSASANTPS